MTKIEMIERAIAGSGTASRHEVEEMMGCDPSIGPLLTRLERRGIITALPVREHRGAGGRLVTVYHRVVGEREIGPPPTKEDPHRRLAGLLRAAAAELDQLAS
jgi:hypothetical protein